MSYVDPERYDPTQAAHKREWDDSPNLHKTYTFLGFKAEHPHKPEYQHNTTTRIFRIDLDKPKKEGRTLANTLSSGHSSVQPPTSKATAQVTTTPAVFTFLPPD
jgi:hypothetical protein